MFLRHNPDGGSETIYEFLPKKVKSNRAAIAEKLYSRALGERRTWEQFVSDALNGSIAARRIALWLVIAAQHPTARLEDIPDFETGELTMEYSRHEQRLQRQAILGSDEMLDSEKRMLLAQVDRAIETALVGSDEPDPEPAEDLAEPGLPAGKDLPSSGEPSTS